MCPNSDIKIFVMFKGCNSIIYNLYTIRTMNTLTEQSFLLKKLFLSIHGRLMLVKVSQFLHMCNVPLVIFPDGGNSDVRPCWWQRWEPSMVNEPIISGSFTPFLPVCCIPVDSTRQSVQPVTGLMQPPPSGASASGTGYFSVCERNYGVASSALH